MTQSDPNWQGVDPKWYDEKIMPMAIGYDIVLLVLPLDQWPYNNSARGWRTDNEQGAVQLQIATTEFEQLQWPNFPYMSAFFQLARHEIMHALFMISGQYDLTHAFWNLGKLEMARDMIKLPQDYYFQTLMRTVNYLKSLSTAIAMEQKTPSQIIYEKALSLADKGIDASPKDKAPDDLACAESVTTVINSIYPAMPIILGTGSLYEKLLGYCNGGNWIQVKLKRGEIPEEGLVIISPTGYNSNKAGMPHGHTGITGKNGVIYSNRSSSGTWDSYWSIAQWWAYYGDKGGYPVCFFKKVK